MNSGKRRNYTVLETFPDARARLLRDFENAYQAHKSGYMRKIGGNSTMGQLFNLKFKDSYFTTRTQSNLIEHYENVSFDDVYKWIVSKASFSFDQSYEPFLGEYKYWRSFPNQDNQTIYDVRVGKLKVTQADNILIYQHGSTSASGRQEWEDDGLAFFHGRRLYCIGFREGNIRLVIAHIPDNVSKQALRGIVLSTQKANQKIFSAAFAMFHQSNTEMFALSEGEVSKEQFKKLGLAEPYMDEKIMID